MKLDSGAIPKHYQLSEQIRRQIEAGELQPGDQLATEDALCQQYGISRGTVRRALDTLLHEGLIVRVQGHGTFVAETAAPSGVFSLLSFNDAMRRQNRRPSTRVLVVEVIPATAKIAQQLALVEGTPVIKVERLRFADRVAVVHETRYLAETLCPALIEEDLNALSIHHLLIDKYNIPLVKMIHTIEMHQLTGGEAQLLDAETGAPAFFVDRLTYTREGEHHRPAVWYRAIYRADEFQLNAVVG